MEKEYKEGVWYKFDDGQYIKSSGVVNKATNCLKVTEEIWRGKYQKFDRLREYHTTRVREEVSLSEIREHLPNFSILNTIELW